MASNATTFASVLANSKYGSVTVPPQLDYVIDTVSNMSVWAALATLFAVLVVYDQGEREIKLAVPGGFFLEWTSR